MLAVPVNALLKAGGPTTVSVPDAVPPAPVSVVLTLPVVLFLTPAVVPLTLTLIAHVAGLAPIEPPVRLMLVSAAFGEKVPPQVLVAAGVASTSTPAGKLSLMLRLFSVNAFEFEKLIVRVDVPPTVTCAGEKAFVTDGGVPTLSVALAVEPAPPSVEVTA